MAARTTHSASDAASGSSDDASRCLLLALSHDELGVIFDGLADPLQPVVAVAFSSTCLGLRTPLQAAIELLKTQHASAVALCSSVRTTGHPCSCALMRDAENLDLTALNADDMGTLAMILGTNGLPMLQRLVLFGGDFGDEGMQALCEGLRHGGAPSLTFFACHSNQVGPAGAEALATALRKGALPKLVTLALGSNHIGTQGATALATPLRQLPALKELVFELCEIGNEGVASLLGNLGKDDFKVLEGLHLNDTEVTDMGSATIISALKCGKLPALFRVGMKRTLSGFTPNISSAARDALDEAIQEAIRRR